MFNEPTVGKVTQILKRADGSEVRIIAEAFFGRGLHQSVDIRVHKRATPNDEWLYCSDQMHPDWRSMSVAEYIERGRSPMRQTVSFGEIVRASQLIGKPIAELSPAEYDLVIH